MEKEKLSYTEDEIQELIHWFDGRSLPKELWVDACTHLMDAGDTVRKIIKVIEGSKHTIPLLGYVFLLEKIRHKLSEPTEKGDKTDNKTP